jgi:hypothetical protein
VTLFAIGATVAVIAFLTGVWYGVAIFAPARACTTTPESTPVVADLRDRDWQGFITAYQFPDGMLAKARTRCPATTTVEDLDTGLREFFLACGSVSDLAAAMPSQTVDEAWHEFITYTRDYAAFCDRAFGRLLHHIPETTMTASELSNNHGRGMLVAWIAACKHESLDLFGATAPVLFDADSRTATLLGGFLPNGKKAVRYVGFCGKDRTKTDTAKRCTARKGTVCMRHAYADAWTGFPTEFATATLPSVKPIARTKAPAAAAKTTPARSTSRSRTSGTSSTSTSYDSTGAIAGFLAVSTVSDPAPAPAPSSHSSCGSVTSTSSCGGGCGGGD